MTDLMSLRVGVEHTVLCKVGQSHMVSQLMPGIDVFEEKPDVMASAWLIGVCEWAAMTALHPFMAEQSYSLGARVDVTHTAPVLAGAELWATARCSLVKRRYSEWSVDINDGYEKVMMGTVGLVVVDVEDFERSRLAPKRGRFRERGIGNAGVRVPSLTGRLQSRLG